MTAREVPFARHRIRTKASSAAAALSRAKQEEKAFKGSSLADLSDLASPSKPLQLLTELLRQCISVFSSDPPRFSNRQKLSSREIAAGIRKRGSSKELKRISAQGFCTFLSSSDEPQHEVSFRWLKLAENVFKDDIRTIGSHRQPPITLPMVFLESPSARPSDKTSKGWEIIKSGMDYVLGRSIIPVTRKKPSEMSHLVGRDVFLSTGNASQYQRCGLDSKDGSASSSAHVSTPLSHPGQVLALAQESKGVVKPSHLFRCDALAGAMAGTCVSLCLHPIDTVKTVIQAQSLGQRSIFHTLLTIISKRGFFGLYRGFGTNLASSAPISAIYTFTYESVKAALLPHLPKVLLGMDLLELGCHLDHPQMEIMENLLRNQLLHWLELLYGCFCIEKLTFLGILKNGGLSVLYSGWVAVLCRNVPQSVIKFYTYEGLKHYALGGQPDGTPLSTYQTLAFGGVAGSTAALFTTPFDVIKTRLQTQIPGSVLHQKSVFQIFQHIATSEGVGGLYRGLIPRLVIYVSQGALFFAAYEFFKQVLAMEVKKFSVLTYHPTDIVGQGKVIEPT